MEEYCSEDLIIFETLLSLPLPPPEGTPLGLQGISDHDLDIAAATAIYKYTQTALDDRIKTWSSPLLWDKCKQALRLFCAGRVLEANQVVKEVCEVAIFYCSIDFFIRLFIVLGSSEWDTKTGKEASEVIIERLRDVASHFQEPWLPFSSHFLNPKKGIWRDLMSALDLVLDHDRFSRMRRSTLETLMQMLETRWPNNGNVYSLLAEIASASYATTSAKFMAPSPNLPQKAINPMALNFLLSTDHTELGTAQAQRPVATRSHSLETDSTWSETDGLPPPYMLSPGPLIQACEIYASVGRRRY